MDMASHMSAPARCLIVPYQCMSRRSGGSQRQPLDVSQATARQEKGSSKIDNGQKILVTDKMQIIDNVIIVERLQLEEASQ